MVIVASVRVPRMIHLLLDSSEDGLYTLGREALKVINQTNCLVRSIAAEGGYIARALANKVLESRGGRRSMGLGTPVTVSLSVSLIVISLRAAAAVRAPRTLLTLGREPAGSESLTCDYRSHHNCSYE